MPEENNPKESKSVDLKPENKQINDTNEIIPEEVLEGIPVEERGKVVSIIKQSMFSGVMRQGNSMSEKITSEHITKLIDKSDSQDIRDRAERKSQRNYNLIILLIGLVFFGFLVVFLKEDKELLSKIIIGVISFVGGFGYGKTKSKKEE